MEQARKGKARGQAGAKDLAAVEKEKEKVAARAAVREKEKAAAGEKVKAAVRAKGKAVDKISRLFDQDFEERKELHNAKWRQNRSRGNGTHDRARSRLLRRVSGAGVHESCCRSRGLGWRRLWGGSCSLSSGPLWCSWDASWLSSGISTIRPRIRPRVRQGIRPRKGPGAMVVNPGGTIVQPEV